MNQGKILLVGFGPGAKQHMTLRALEAIKEADVVIGYSTYIKLVQDQLEGKEVVRKGMTEELDRSIEAYEQAKLGKIVALISSGDIGVYGMAGPTYEVLLQSGWTPDSDIQVEVIPGSTALSACASLVGAPLTHDFCSISLSDLLTPWPVIAQRLEAAAQSDFVVALYNPKSGRRTQQIVEAQRILLQYRKPETPVAIVKSAYREKQDIKIVRLDEMIDYNIGMLTTVLIGNSTTFIEQGLMITPRGYANKYDPLTGEVKGDEKRGRSLSTGLDGWKLNQTTKKSDTDFSKSEQDVLYRVMRERRDMRHFIENSSIDADVLQRILKAAHTAPSVGLMQPWRFIQIKNPELREAVAVMVDQERIKTAELLEKRQEEFLELKVEGIRECAALIAVVQAPDDGTVLGRRTLPEEMALCSTACAIQNLWLASRVENLGLGWVSLFDPKELAELLGCPEGAKPIALLCIGPVKQFYDKPMLEQVGWRQGKHLEEFLFEDRWPEI